MKIASLPLLVCLSFLQALAIRRVHPSTSLKLGSVLVDVSAQGEVMNDTESEHINSSLNPLHIKNYPVTPIEDVEQWIKELICKGDFWASWKLSVHYTKKCPLWDEKKPVVKFAGKPDSVGDQTFKRIGDFGKAHAVAAVYEYSNGDDQYVIVALQSAFEFQTRKILWNSTFWKFDTVQWPESKTEINIGHYIASKTEKLWTTYKLGEFLLGKVKQLTQPYMFLFTGLSHGAALSQVLSLRFELARRAQDEHWQNGKTSAIFWGGYRVFDTKGNDRLHEKLGGRVAHFIHGYHDEGREKLVYDPIPTIFKRIFGFADVKTRYIFDQKGNFRQCNDANSCPYDEWLNLFLFLHRVRWYHGSPPTEPNVEKIILTVARSMRCDRARDTQTDQEETPRQTDQDRQ